jgi:hypothetical protein
MSTRVAWRNGIFTFYDGSTHERVGPMAPVALYDDFLTPSLVIPAAGALESGCNWAAKITGSGTVAGIANGGNGEVRCTIAADVNKQDCGLYFADQLTLNATQGLVFEARVKVSTATSLEGELVWGVCGAWADGLDAITYSAWFTVDGSLLVYCEKDDNATDQSVTSGITVVATDYHVYRIDFSDVANVRYYIDGVAVAEATTFPWAATAGNSKVQPYLGGYKIGTGAGVGVLDIDYVRVWQNRS